MHTKQQQFNLRPGRRFGNRHGSVLMECVLAFPLIFALACSCLQLAHIWIARQVVQYAAFTAARSTLVCSEGEYQDAAQQAAEQVLSWAVIGKAQGERDKGVPGWGAIPGSGGVHRKTRVQITPLGQWNVKAVVEFDFALVVPVAGPLIGWWVAPHENIEQRADPTGNAHRYVDMVPFPHLRFKETAIISKPYVTLPDMGIPSGGW